MVSGGSVEQIETLRQSWCARLHGFYVRIAVEQLETATSCQSVGVGLIFTGFGCVRGNCGSRFVATLEPLLEVETLSVAVDSIGEDLSGKLIYIFRNCDMKY